MKKIFAILMTICLAVSVLCIAVFAAEASVNAPTPGTVLRLSAQRKDGTTVVIKDYDDFEEGWEAAVDYAEDTKTMKTSGYDRVVVDFYADWTANDDGEFGSGGDGFEWSAIHITEDIRITLNLNGHTINRNLKEWEYDGEVIYIDENANVIINNGTISGGWSCNGAGGLHICEKARVVLNNVNIVNNKVDDDDGAGIAVYKGAILTVNGGSFRDNVTDGVDVGAVQGAAVYVENATATFSDVLFKSNQSFITYAEGMAIFATKSTVTVNNCTFEENGIANAEKGFTTPITLVNVESSSITIKSSTFKGNGCRQAFTAEDSDFVIEGTQFTGNSAGNLIVMDDSVGSIKDTTIKGNTSDIFYILHTEADITNVTVTDNSGETLYLYNDDDEIVTMTKCTLGNNTHSTSDKSDVYIIGENTLVFVDSTLGDTIFNDEDYVTVIYSGVEKEDAAISVTKLSKDGTKETVYHRFFEYGWNLAVEAALTNSYDRIIVDLYGDWNAVDGQFTDDFNNGSGFNWDAIYFPANVRMTLNMNGKTINRGLTEAEMNGEVMYIDENADVIINSGTIKGGFSNNGAGGIHINDGAKVTLNDVNVIKNNVENDDGAGIAVYDKATLIMNGGSVSDNVVHLGFTLASLYGGGIYIEESTAILTGVTFKNNVFKNKYAGRLTGAAIYSEESTVTLKECSVEDNGTLDEDGGNYIDSVIYAYDSVFYIENTNFSGNGSKDIWTISTGASVSASTVISVFESDLTLTGGKFTDNNTVYLVTLNNGKVNADGVDFTGNNCCTLYVRIASSAPSTFNNCKFSASTDYSYSKNDFKFNNSQSNVVFIDSDFGEAVFSDTKAATFIDCGVSNNVGSIFGEGSLTVIVAIIAILALVASGVSIFLIADMKKKLAPATASSTEEQEDEEDNTASEE